MDCDLLRPSNFQSKEMSHIHFPLFRLHGCVRHTDSSPHIQARLTFLSQDSSTTFILDNPGLWEDDLNLDPIHFDFSTAFP